MLERKSKLLFTYGGTFRPTVRVTIPFEWLIMMKITKDERNLSLTDTVDSLILEKTNDEYIKGSNNVKKVIFSSSGVNSTIGRITLPQEYIWDLGLDEDNKDIRLIFTEDKKVIIKAANPKKKSRD